MKCNVITGRDVSAGATGATKVAPKFSKTLTYSNQGGQILPTIAEVDLNFSRDYVPAFYYYL